MKVEFKISGVGRLRKVFQDTRRKASSASVAVGYTADYAIHVHENVGANFKTPGTKAKFLEDPAREHRDDIRRAIEDEMEAGGSLRDGLLVGGLLLQRFSQLECPVDTGFLRASAFTRLER